MSRSGFPRFSYFALAALGGCFILAAVFFAPFSIWERGWVIPAGFCAGLAAAYFAPRLGVLRNQYTALAVVLGAALLTGSVWLLLTRVSPDVGGARDFLRMYETAEAFASGLPLPEPAYQAVFPHLLGYPLFLSLFFRLFGASVATAQAVNLLLSLCSAALLFSIGRKLLGPAGGLAAGLIWALTPSQFMLLSLVANEPLHIALTLCAARIFLFAFDRLPYSPRGAIMSWLLLGAVVGLTTLVRPIGPVYIAAFVLIAAVFGSDSAGRWKKLVLSGLAVTAAYICVAQLGTAFWERALERPVAGGGFGWNLYVGMNPERSGNWTPGDYEVMAARLEQGLPAPEIQALFAEEAFSRARERVREGGVLRFMMKKYANLWHQDSFTVYWLSLGARADSPLDIRAGPLSVLCNLAYGFLLGCCALSLFRQLKTGGEAFILPVVLLLGVTILFILLEANPRYHYAGTAALCLLAAGCAASSKESVTNE